MRLLWPNKHRKPFDLQVTVFIQRGRIFLMAYPWYGHVCLRLRGGYVISTRTFLCDLIAHPCPNYNRGSAKPTLKLGHEWVIPSYVLCRCAYLSLLITNSIDLLCTFLLCILRHKCSCISGTPLKWLQTIHKILFCPTQHVQLTWWRNQMEAFFALLALCAGNSPVTGDFPSQRPVMRSLMFLWSVPEQTVE